jgi:hypothetical protein
MPECEARHKDVKRITKYSKTGQWLCETCVADLEKPPVQIPPASATSDENKKGKGTGETWTAFTLAYGRSWQSRRWSHDALN